MNLSRFAVERPVFISMIALMVVVLGGAALSRLRIDLLPAVEVPTFSVRTSYAGADPEVVERLVTQILEEIINTVPGVVELKSTSTEGSSSIGVTFAWGTDVNSAASDVRARIEEELDELPDEVDKPIIRKFDIASYPVVVLGVGSDELDPLELNDLVERQLRYRFARLAGVAQVDIWGGYAREIRIELIPERVLALGLSLQQVMSSIRNSNLDLPIGTIDEGRSEVVLRAPSEFKNLEQIRSTIIEVKNGASLELRHVAKVVETYSKLNRIVNIDGAEGIRVAIRKEADANTVEVSRAILAQIEAVREDFPQVKVVAMSNQGNFIERSIVNVAHSVLYGGSLAILILLFFLRSFSSTLVIAVSIPLSIFATLVLVYGGGLTLNLMTLGGLALGIGMMVDSSIVVLENIFRHRDEEGDSIKHAAIKGSSEVTSAIVASTITTLVIFLPLAFTKGVAALLFGELALVVVYSLLASLFVALTLVPMLASKILKEIKSSGDETQRANGFVKWATSVLHALEMMYAEVLVRVLNFRWWVISVSFLLLGVSSLLWPLIGTDFMPPSDEGEVRIKAEFEPFLRLELANQIGKEMEQLVMNAVPERQALENSVSVSGGRGNSSAKAEITLNVGNAQQRGRSNTEIAKDLSRELEGKVPGAKLSVRAPQGQFVLERILGGNEGLKIEIRGFDLDELSYLSQQVQALLKGIDGVNNIEDDLDDALPQENIRIDRAKVANLGLSLREVSEALEVAVNGRLVGDYRPQGYSVPIRVQLHQVEKLPLQELLGQTLKTPSGEFVALSNLVHTDSGYGPAKITRKDQQRALTIDVDVLGRPLGSVAKEIVQALKDIVVPSDYDIKVVGSYEEQEKAFAELLLSFGLALVLVYMVLACQYESLKDPLVVMFAVPVSAIGVAIILYLTKSSLNLQSGIGCIMLGGIVVNNAILLVDQTSGLVKGGMAIDLALTEAGRRRLRPILMTTLTTILGLLPLAFGIGEGADAQAPLARAVLGGLCASTLMTLLLVPAIYSLVHSEQRFSKESA